MSKKKTATIATANMGKTKAQKKTESRTIHVMSSLEATLASMPYINAYSNGCGVHGGSKKARNKRSRQENKRACRDYE